MAANEGLLDDDVFVHDHGAIVVPVTGVKSHRLVSVLDSPVGLQEARSATASVRAGVSVFMISMDRVH